MDIHNLAEQLRDPDPRIRVETLRILAMLEETRALPAVRWIYKYDPEAGVRDVANWTGQLLWAAHKRGHSTLHAVEEMYNQPMSPEHQARFLEALEFDGVPTRNLKIQKYAAEQAFQRQLTEALQENRQENEPAPALPEPDSANQTDESDDLLDAGLTNWPTE